MDIEKFEDFFDFRFGPFQMCGFTRPFKVDYSRTSDGHRVKLKLRPDIKKKEINVKLQEKGVLEIEWPRRAKGEDISID